MLRFIHIRRIIQIIRQKYDLTVRPFRIYLQRCLYSILTVQLNIHEQHFERSALIGQERLCIRKIAKRYLLPRLLCILLNQPLCPAIPYFVIITDSYYHFFT